MINVMRIAITGLALLTRGGVGYALSFRVIAEPVTEEGMESGDASAIKENAFLDSHACIRRDRWRNGEQVFIPKIVAVAEEEPGPVGARARQVNVAPHLSPPSLHERTPTPALHALRNPEPLAAIVARVMRSMGGEVRVAAIAEAHDVFVGQDDVVAPADDGEGQLAQSIGLADDQRIASRPRALEPQVAAAHDCTEVAGQ
jgi:hypothetical protein